MDISQKLTAVAKKFKVRFTLNDKPIGHDKIFSPTGLLPALARRADQLCSLCLGYGIGANFDEADDSILGVKVTFDDVTPDILRLMCITDVLNEIIKASRNRESIALDELMYD